MSASELDSPALYIHERGSPEDAYQLWPGSENISAGAIQEKGEYVFELRGVKNPLKAELTVEREDVEPLRPPEDLSAARWRWEPGFHAGQVDIHIDLGNGHEVSTQIVTDPDVRKLTREQFNQMLRDILDDTFALFNLSGFTTGISKGTGDETPPIARLEFLRSRMEDLEDTIRRVSQRPVRLLRTENRSLPLHKVSSATGPEIARSFRTENVRKESDDRNRLPPRFKGHFPDRIRKSTQASGLDIREHQDMKSCLRSWSQWLRVVADRLETEGDSDNRDRKYREAQRCRRLTHRLQNLLQLPLFENVTDRSSPVRITSIYRRIPAYRSFFQIHNDLQLGIARITGDFLEIPLARTFDLYEVWCFLRLLRAATRYLTGGDPEVEPIFDFDPDSGSVEVSATHAEISLGNGVFLCFKRRYREYWLTETGRGSFSRTMEPDLSISLPPFSPGEGEQPDSSKGDEEGTDGSSSNSSSPEALLILDAKYRIESGLSDAIASIHTYRDALVEDQGDHQPRIVNGAYLLSPREPDDSEQDWKKTDMPYRLFHPKYRGEFHFGAATLRPGMSLDEVYDALKAILDDTGVEPAKRKSPSTSD